MKKIIFISLSAVLLFGCLAKRPATNYTGRELPPYTIEITYRDQHLDTLQVQDFRLWQSFFKDSYYVIKPIGTSRWVPIYNVNTIKILQANMKPERVKIQRTFDNNPHNYQYNYWD